MKNTVIKSVFVLALACSGASCTGNYLEINSNPYEVTEEEMQRKGYAISSYLNAIFGTIISPDVNTTQFTDALLGGTQGGYFADSQNGWKTTISNYNPTNDWTRVFMYSDRIIPVLYSNLMKLNGISEDPIVLSIAKIAKVCAMNRVTDAYGPIPYSEIGISGKIQVPYDTQADVYRQMFDELDEAIEMLTAHSSEAITASTDPVYEGSAEKWCKFANSMKLRLAMRVVYTDFTSSKGKTPRQLAEEAVSNKVGVFTSNSDNAKLPSVAFGKDGNPLRAACLYNQPEGSNTGGDTHAAADIICYMNGYDDPRRDKYFIKSEWEGIDYVGIRRGIEIPSLNTIGRKYSGVKFENDAETPLYWMNAAEVAFLKAEAKAVFDMNMGPGTARDFYEEGVRLSFEQWGVTGVAEYLAGTTLPQTYIDPNGGANSDKNNSLSRLGVAWDDSASKAQMQERIITQKWIANWQLGNEAWADYRRTGFPRLLPATANKSSVVDSKLGARRMPYPTEERTSNAENYAKAVALLGGSDNMATRIWSDCNPDVK